MQILINIELNLYWTFFLSTCKCQFSYFWFVKKISKVLEEKKQFEKNQIIKLNIGGVRFHTTYETLTSKGDNYISSLVTSEKIPVILDKEGKY